MGRIEPLKNQVNLLKAMQGQNIDVVIEGKMQPYHRSYNKQFKKIIDSNQIERRIVQLAETINHDYMGEDVILIRGQPRCSMNDLISMITLRCFFGSLIIPLFSTSVFPPSN